jgi:hypothetical protein
MEIITFYDVPLVCGAAPAIGCGSRAKPLLMDLEQRTAIKEAWLNRAGTIVAIVWSGPARTEEVAKPGLRKLLSFCYALRESVPWNERLCAARRY